MIRNSILLYLSLFLISIVPAMAQRQMENLNRGIVAVKQSDSVYISWRLFGTDPDTVAFNLYRISGSDEPVKVNTEPITDSTNFIDNNADTKLELQYFVRPVLENKELEASKPVRAWDKNYLEIPIQTIPDYKTVVNEIYLK